MNIERLEALAARIEAMPHVPDDTTIEQTVDGFNMNVWRKVHPCGSVCCIGGTAIAMSGRAFGYAPDAAEWLEIPEETATDLFWPDLEDDTHYSDVSPARAAAVIRNLIKTGEVDWSVGATP